MKVRLETGQLLEFPDGTTPEQIEEVISKDFTPQEEPKGEPQASAEGIGPEWNPHPDLSRADEEAVEQPWLDPVDIVSGAAGGKLLVAGGKFLLPMVTDVLGSIAADVITSKKDVGFAGGLATHVAVDMLSGKALSGLKRLATASADGKVFSHTGEMVEEFAHALRQEHGVGADEAFEMAEAELGKFLSQEKITPAVLAARLKQTPVEDVRAAALEAAKVERRRIVLEPVQEVAEEASKVTPKATIPEHAQELIAKFKEGALEVPTVQKSGVGNFARYSSVDDVKKLHAEMGRATQETYQGLAGGQAGKKTLQEINEESLDMVKKFEDETGIDPMKLREGAKDFYEKVKDVAPELTHWRRILAGASEDLDYYLQKVTSGRATDLEILQFVESEKLFREIKPLIEGAQTSVSRGTTQGNIVVDGSELIFRQLVEEDVMSDVLKSTQIRAELEKIGGREAVELIATKFQENAKKGLKGKIETVNATDSVWRAFSEGYIASMLTSPTTIKTNVFGNIGKPFVENIEDYTAWILGLAKKGEQMSFKEASRRTQATFSSMFTELLYKPLIKAPMAGFEYLANKSLLEIVADLPKLKPTELEKVIGQSGILHTFKEGAGGSGPAMSRARMANTKTGQVLGARNADSTLWKLFDEGAAVARVGFSALKMTDNPFGKIGYDVELKGQITRKLIASGGFDNTAANLLHEQVGAYRKLVQEAKKAGTTSLPSAAVKAQLNVSPKRLKLIQELDDMATSAAKRNTWQDASPNKVVQGFEQMVNGGGMLGTSLRLGLFPFVKTPINLMSYAARHIPFVAPISKRWQLDMAAGGIRRTKAQSQLVTGSMLIASIAKLTADGHLNGTFSDSDREVLGAAGIKENSLKVDDTYYDISRMDPFGLLVNLVADITYKSGEMKDEDLTTVLLNIGLAAGSNVYSKSWLTGVGDIMRVLESRGDPQRKAEAMNRLLANKFMPIIPLSSGIKHAVRADDEFMMSVNGVREYVEQTLGFGKDIPRHDIFGQAVPRAVFGYTGIKTSELREDSPIRMELANLGMSIKRMPATLEGAELPTEEAEKLRAILSRPELDLEGTLNRFIGQEGWRDIPDPSKRQFITEMFRSTREAAKGIYKGENIEITTQALKQKGEAIVDQWLTAPEEPSDNIYQRLINRNNHKQKPKPLSILKE